MNIFKVIFDLFILYILYKVIFDFIIPIYKTTRQMRQKMGDMQNQMNREPTVATTDNSFSHRPKAGKADYIDFEEVK